MNDLQYSKQQLSEIATFQKIMIWIVLVGVVASVLPPLQLFPSVVFIVYLYRLARSLKVPRAWVYVLGLFLPLVNFVVVFNIFGKATKALRAGDVRVGVMGANKEDLAKLSSSK